MTDEEKAEITEEYLINTFKQTEENQLAIMIGQKCFSEGLEKGLAEGRKESAKDIEVLTKENAELKAQNEKMKKNCLDVMRVQGINLTDDYMAGMYNGMVVIYNSCFLDTVNELEKSYCSKNENGKWESA